MLTYWSGVSAFISQPLEITASLMSREILPVSNSKGEYCSETARLFVYCWSTACKIIYNDNFILNSLRRRPYIPFCECQYCKLLQYEFLTLKHFLRNSKGLQCSVVLLLHQLFRYQIHWNDWFLAPHMSYAPRMMHDCLLPQMCMEDAFWSNKLSQMKAWWSWSS